MEQSDKRARIVITGATGMLGNYLTAYLLKEGYTDITVIARSEESLKKLEGFLAKRGLEIGAVDVRIVPFFGKKALTEIFCGKDIVYNCAAVVSLEDGSSQHLIEDNVRLAYNVAEAAYDAKTGKLIHVSSIAALSSRPFPELTTENSHIVTLMDKSPYSIGKFFAENEVWRMSQKGLKTIVVNPAVILGEGDWNGSGSPAMFRFVYRMSSFYTEGVTGYVSANDVARFMEKLTFKAEAVGKRFILCGENLSYGQLITYMAESLGRRKPGIRIGRGMLKTVEKVYPFLYRKGSGGFLPRYAFRSLREKVRYDGTYAESVAGIRYTPIRDEIKIIAETYLKDIKN